MKKEHLIIGIVFFAFAVLIAGFASASCDLGVILLNQDPYPATPGEYVKVVFQINGTENPDCQQAFFNLKPEYPFSLESSDTRTVMLGGTFIDGYSSYILKAYKLIVDENALDGDNKLTFEYGFQKDGATSDYTKEFNINVKEARTNFEVSVQDYDAVKNTITFGIINIGKYDIESLTLEIPEQDNIKIIGSDISIIGSLNSNDDTTANVEGIPNEGEITVNLNYNDQNDVRRVVEKQVYFSSSFIEKAKAAAQTTRDIYFYLFWVVLVIFVARFFWGWNQRRKAKNNKLALLRR